MQTSVHWKKGKSMIVDSEMQRFRASGLSERERIESDAEMQRCRDARAHCTESTQ